MDASALHPLYLAHASALQRATLEALAANGFDAVVLHSGAPAKRSRFDDAYWPLRVTPHFQHWVPFEEADCAVLVGAGARPRLLRRRVTDFWEAPPPLESEHFFAAFDTAEIQDFREVRSSLPAGKRVAFIGEDPAAGEALGLAAEAINPPALLRALDRLRIRKSPYEVECLAEANRRAAAGHAAVREAFEASEQQIEFDLHLAYLRASRQDDWQTPYKNIVALDAHSATLHHISYAKHARPAKTLLLDAGATYAGYCSDITRTFVKGEGAAGSAFAGLTSAVERLQQRLCGAVRVGLHYEALHDESHRQVAQALCEVGVSRVSVDETVASGASRVFFPHGLGHSLGLQTHDVGCADTRPRADNPFLRNTTVIAEGQVFTIEPGIYFIESLLAPLRQGPRAADIDWKLVDALAPLGGIRIEDDVVVQPGGVRNLTREQPALR